MAECVLGAAGLAVKMIEFGTWYGAAPAVAAWQMIASHDRRHLPSCRQLGRCCPHDWRCIHEFAWCCACRLPGQLRHCPAHQLCQLMMFAAPSRMVMRLLWYQVAHTASNQVSSVATRGSDNSRCADIHSVFTHWISRAIENVGAFYREQSCLFGSRPKAEQCCSTLASFAPVLTVCCTRSLFGIPAPPECPTKQTCNCKLAPTYTHPARITHAVKQD